MREGYRRRVSWHEAAHVLVIHLLGLSRYTECTFTDAGGVTHHDTIPIRDAHMAWLQCVVYWAGIVAEKLELPADENAAFDKVRDRGEGSDHLSIVLLACHWAPDAPEKFSESARTRAALILMLYRSQLLEAANRLYDGDKLTEGFPPLVDLKPRRDLARPPKELRLAG